MLTIKFSDIGDEVQIVDMTGNMMAKGYLESIEGDRDTVAHFNGQIRNYGDIRLTIVVTEKFSPMAPLMAVPAK